MKIKSATLVTALSVGLAACAPQELLTDVGRFHTEHDSPSNLSLLIIAGLPFQVTVGRGVATVTTCGSAE